MKTTVRQNKLIAFSLAVVLCFVSVFAYAGLNTWSSTRAEAATGPEDTTGIVVTGGASGAALAVDPTMVISEVVVEAVTTTAITYRWSPVTNATAYYLYKYDTIAGQYQLAATTTDVVYQLTDLPAGEECYVTICAVNDVVGCRGDFTVPLRACTKPERLNAFTISGNTATTVTLSWTDVPSATGYLIYRAGTGGNFKQVGTTEGTQYVDKELDPAKIYQYKIITYAYSTDNIGEESPIQFTCTLPSAPSIKVKGGDEKIRISWNAITRAEGYTVYMYQDSQYVPVAVLEGKSNKTYIHAVPNDETHEYYVTAYRIYEGITYESAISNVAEGTSAEVDETSTEAKLFKTQKAFKKSDALKNNKDFKKKVKYNKSFVIPGMIHTNVGGFSCTSMVPQGVTFAKSYLFITAYDYKKEENSVVYVVKKSNKELMTTIVLPNKSHAGGIAFDGKNLWITQSKTLRSIPYSAVSEAIENQEPYVEIAEYGTENALTHQAATVTYYKGLLWVASYDELKAGYMGSYKIKSKGSKPTLTLCKKIKMPNRVQGITFTSNGRFIVSRSCQTDPKKRGFLHQLDVYKPNLKKASKGIITLGKVRNQIDMPSMNEEVAVNGSFLYVNYESVFSPSAVNPMDRVCALPISFVTKLKKVK